MKQAFLFFSSCKTCSVKQKHSILLKKLPTEKGTTLKLACAAIGLSLDYMLHKKPNLFVLD